MPRRKSNPAIAIELTVLPARGRARRGANVLYPGPAEASKRRKFHFGVRPGSARRVNAIVIAMCPPDALIPAKGAHVRPGFAGNENLSWALREVSRGPLEATGLPKFCWQVN